MENTVNSRILLLKTKSELNTNEFAIKANISPITFWNAKKGEKISDQTLRKISKAMRVNYEWLLTGEGEVFMEPEVEVKEQTMPWKDEAYQLLKAEVLDLREKHNQAMQMVSKMIDRMSLGKLNSYALTAKERKTASLLHN